MKRPASKLHVKDPDVNRVQDGLITSINDIVASEIIDGVLLQGVRLDYLVVNNVKHTLGRVPLGYLVVGQTCPTVVYNPEPMTKELLRLGSTSSSIVNLWVF